MKILAIDPGSAGGLAAYDSTTGETTCKKMPDTEGDVLETLRSLRATGLDLAIIESQTGCVGPKVRVAASSMFTFGQGYGFLLGALMALGYRIELVRAQKWQAKLSLGKKKDCASPVEWKNKLKAMAQRLYPTCDVTLATADALLILEYAKRSNLALP